MMSPAIAICALASGAVTLLLLPWVGQSLDDEPQMPTDEAPAAGALMRFRWLVSTLAGVSGAVFVGGRAGSLAALAVGIGAWVLIGRIEPPAVRRRREAISRDLPHLVTLLSAALRSGAAPGPAAHTVAVALPGPAADRLALVSSQLELGADPAAAWLALRDEPALSPLGRCLARAQETGAPVTAAVDRLAEELARSARAEVEDRARAVGVKAAVPLGLCLLPAFILIGIVPLVAGLMSNLSW